LKKSSRKGAKPQREENTEFGIEEVLTERTEITKDHGGEEKSKKKLTWRRGARRGKSQIEEERAQRRQAAKGRECGIRNGRGGLTGRTEDLEGSRRKKSEEEAHAEARGTRRTMNDQ